MYNGHLIIDGAVIAISGNVQCSDDGCPTPNAVAKGKLFNKDTHRICLDSDTHGDEGYVCVASVRGILHAVFMHAHTPVLHHLTRYDRRQFRTSTATSTTLTVGSHRKSQRHMKSWC